MKLAALAFAGIALGGCADAPEPEPVVAAPAVPAERVEAFTIAARQIGCTIDPVSHEPMHRAGFSDAEMDEIAAQLLAEGRAHRTASGALVIEPEDCV